MIRSTAFVSVLGLCVFGIAGCGSSKQSDGAPTAQGGAAGSAGANGSAGAAGSAGTAGSAGSASNCPTPSATPGALDTTFGGGGSALVREPGATGGAIFVDVALQADDKLVALGNDAGKMVLFRLNGDGTLDTAFGTAGFVVADSVTESGGCLTIDSNGNVLVGGSAGLDGNGWVKRYTSSGAPDTTFGTNGRVALDYGTNNDHVWKLLARSDGSLVVGGISDFNGVMSATNLSILDASGALLKSVGTAGVLQIRPGNARYLLSALAAQADGSLFAFGEATVGTTGKGSLFWAKLDAQGALDTSYGQAGVLSVAGSFSSAIGVTSGSDHSLTGWAQGATIQGFDTGGAARAFSASTVISVPKSVALDCSGNLLLAGLVSGAGSFHGGLARFTATGSKDPSFGVSGLVEWIPSMPAELMTARLLPNGKIVVGGSDSDSFALFRYLP